MIPAGFIEGKDIKGPLVHILQDQAGKKELISPQLLTQISPLGSWPAALTRDFIALSTLRLFPTWQTYIAFTENIKQSYGE